MMPVYYDRTAAAAHRAERAVALDAAAPAAARPGAPGSCRRAADRAAPDPNVHRAAHALVRGGWVQTAGSPTARSAMSCGRAPVVMRTAVRHGRGYSQIHRSGRKDAGHASPRQHPVLHQHIFSAVRGRQVGPEVEAPTASSTARSYSTQPHPGDLVGEPALVRPQVAASQVCRVRGVLGAGSSVATPAARARSARAPDGPTTARTVRARPVGGRAGRTAGRPCRPARTELDDRLVQPSDGARLQPRVVVAEEREGGGRRGQHHGVVLGEPAGQVPRRADPPALPGEHPLHYGGRRGLEDAGPSD